MTFELLVFIFLSIILFFSSNIILNNKYLKVFYIILAISYIFTVRFSGFHDDFINYIEILKYPIQTKIQFFYIKESFYWILSSLIYNLLNNEIATFLLYDFFCLFLLIKITNNLKLPSYFILFYLLIFPSLMGFQNVYRQFIATIIVLYSISLAFNNKSGKYFFFVIAVFTHNVTILVLPLLFIFNNKKVFNFKFIFSIIVIIVALFFESKSKSFSNHGLRLDFIYILVVFLLSYFVFSKSENYASVNSKISIYSIYILILVLVMFFIVGESQLERISMMSIQLLLPFICIYIDKYYHEKRLFRMMLIIMLIIPIFIFKNALNLLTN